MDIEANRNTKKWSNKELLGRMLWGCIQPLFKYSPRLFWGWRTFLLRSFGAKIGHNVHIHPSVKVFIPWNLEVGDWSSVGYDAALYNLGKVSIGKKVTISQRAYLCAGTHDYCDPSMKLQKSTIKIADKVWVCADAFVGPEVSISEGVVLAARSVAVKNLEPWKVYGGNPAKYLKERILD